MSTFGQNSSSDFSVPNKEDLCVKMTAKHNIRILMSNWTKFKNSYFDSLKVQLYLLCVE